MERVQIFFGYDQRELEHRINTWLDEMGDKIEITRTMQAASGSLNYSLVVVITVFYKMK